MAKVTKENYTQSLEHLRKVLKPGDTIGVILRHVSRSGMSRRMSFILPDFTDITWHVHNVTGYPLKDHELVVGGCGMDMGFAVVYDLGRILFPNGFGVKGYQPSGIFHGTFEAPRDREHAAEMVAAGYLFRGRNGNPDGWDNDGGYALNHRWI